MIQSICPNCGNKKMFSDDKSGKKYKCPNCSEVVTIESIGTSITNEHQANVTNTYAASIEQAEENNRIAALQQEYQRIIQKSKNHKIYAYIIFFFAWPIIGVFEGEIETRLFALVWGLLFINWGRNQLKKSEKVALEATEFFNTHLNGSTASQTVYSDQDQQRIDEYYSEHNNDYATEHENLGTMSVNENGVLNISFPGQWFLVDAKTKIFVDGTLHSTHSTKEGFAVNIPLTSDKLKLKLVLGGMKSTTYELEQLNTNRNYKIELQYSDTWGKYSDKFNLIEMTKVHQ